MRISRAIPREGPCPTTSPDCSTSSSGMIRNSWPLSSAPNTAGVRFRYDLMYSKNADLED
jgi:hypothetical protein